MLSDDLAGTVTACQWYAGILFLKSSVHYCSINLWYGQGYKLEMYLFKMWLTRKCIWVLNYLEFVLTFYCEEKNFLQNAFIADIIFVMSLISIYDSLLLCFCRTFLWSFFIVLWLCYCRNTKLTKCWVLNVPKMWKRWELISTMLSAGRLSCDILMNGRYIQ